MVPTYVIGKVTGKLPEAVPEEATEQERRDAIIGNLVHCIRRVQGAGTGNVTKINSAVMQLGQRFSDNGASVVQGAEEELEDEDEPGDEADAA